MTRIRIVQLSLIVALVITLFASAAWAQETSVIRFAHLDAAGPTLDINLNGELAAADLPYGQATGRVNVSAGPAQLSTFLPGTTFALANQHVTLPAGPATVVLAGTGISQSHVISEDLSPLPSGQARLALVNTLDAAVQVSVTASDESQVFDLKLAAGATSNSVETGVGRYDLTITTDLDDMTVKRVSQPLSAGTVNLLLIHGTPAEPALFNAIAAAEGVDDSARLRLIHAIESAAPVDVRVNGQLLVPELSFASPTPHLALPSGAHEFAVSLGAAEIMVESVQLRAGQLSTIVLMRSGGGLGMFHFADAVADVDERSAVVSLINAIPDSAINHLQIASGAIIALNVQANEAGDAANIVPGRQGMTLHLNIAGDQGAVPIPPYYFSGGSHYTLVALAGSAFSAPRLLVAETSLARHIRSTLAPDEVAAPVDEPATEQGAAADEPAMDEQSVEPMAETEETETETKATEEEPADEPATEQTAEVTEPQSIPDDLPTPPEPSLTPYATVNVNPDAALHMRQYPTSDALSLGLLPSQSQLMILGRRGPTEIDGGEAVALPVDLGEYTDAAAGLQPFEDMPAADTWLYAMYKTPDSGALYGWVSAVYLEVFDPDGETQRLASLTHIRQNQPGSAYNTEIQPPELADRVAARVYGLHADALLNLRRSNNAVSEVLSQLPPNQLLQLIGLDESEDWAYVEYRPEIGNPVRGWASMAFIELLLNGSPVPTATLRALDPSTVPVIGDLVAGGIQPKDSDEASPSMAGIIGQVNVNFDSALHLRRYPDATSESLALIPPDTMLELDGVTESGGWYKVEFDSEAGWVAAPYLVLTMDGRTYARSFLESQLPRFNDLGF